MVTPNENLDLLINEGGAIGNNSTGGGRAAIRRNSVDIVTAGGGGGGSSHGTGGDGGGTIGGNGTNEGGLGGSGGRGGTQIVGGGGGGGTAPGESGIQYLGGGGGGGGGGGWYGGGGEGTDSNLGVTYYYGGGGGSSYLGFPPLIGGLDQKGGNSEIANGNIEISWLNSINYLETTTLSFFQSSATPYYQVTATDSELGTLINLPTKDITYLSVAYSSPIDSNITDITLSIKDSISTLGSVSLTFTGEGNDISIASNLMNIATSTDRAVKLVLDGSLSETDYVNIRTILVGFL